MEISSTINGNVDTNIQLLSRRTEMNARLRRDMNGTTEREKMFVESDGLFVQKDSKAPGNQCDYIPPGSSEKEKYRLATFQKFPEFDRNNIILLAVSGFYYTGYKDRVKCFSCASAVENWMLDDDPADAKWHEKDCSMMTGQDGGNVPYHDQKMPLLTRAAGDGVLIYNIKKTPPGSKCTYIAPGNSADEMYRLATFQNFQRYIPIDTVELAECGFLYTGYHDRVICFSCGAMKQNWIRNDSPSDACFHKNDCLMVNGLEKSNVPYKGKLCRCIDTYLEMRERAQNASNHIFHRADSSDDEEQPPNGISSTSESRQVFEQRTLVGAVNPRGLVERGGELNSSVECTEDVDED